MKTPISPEVRQQVLHLRRSYSLSAVAERTGLPLGTVKTICSRSGSFRDNPALRLLFALPPIQPSSGTALAVPELPPQQEVTGDDELDAVLWLREVIKTGQPALIEKAMTAAKLIKTPMDALEERYTKHLVSRNPDNWTVAFKTIGFANLEGLAQKSIEKLALQHEAVSRFGDALFNDTPAEQFCIDTLDGTKPGRLFGLDDGEVDARFKARPELTPNTLSDCLYELGYWHDLYSLRHGCDGGDQGQEAYARECFVFRCLAHIRARTKDEAIAVFHYLANRDCMDRSETESILLNLIG